MSIQLSWASIGIVIAVLGHAIFTVWSAASFKTTISLKMDNLVDAIHRLDKELEKRDIQIAAIWKKLDINNDRITRIEAHQESI